MNPIRIEQRKHHRHKPKQQLSGGISSSNNQELILEAEILDISRTGIRVKLKESIGSGFAGQVKITMTLPDSGTPFSVHGILKHKNNKEEYGLHYVEHVEGSIDDLMYQCIKLDKSTLLIKT